MQSPVEGLKLLGLNVWVSCEIALVRAPRLVKSEPLQGRLTQRLGEVLIQKLKRVANSLNCGSRRARVPIWIWYRLRGRSGSCRTGIGCYTKIKLSLRRWLWVSSGRYHRTVLCSGSDYQQHSSTVCRLACWIVTNFSGVPAGSMFTLKTETGLSFQSWHRSTRLHGIASKKTNLNGKCLWKWSFLKLLRN